MKTPRWAKACKASLSIGTTARERDPHWKIERERSGEGYNWDVGNWGSRLDPIQTLHVTLGRFVIPAQVLMLKRGLMRQSLRPFLDLILWQWRLKKRQERRTVSNMLGKVPAMGTFHTRGNQQENWEESRKHGSVLSTRPRTTPFIKTQANWFPWEKKVNSLAVRFFCPWKCWPVNGSCFFNSARPSSGHQKYQRTLVRQSYYRLPDWGKREPFHALCAIHTNG